MADPLAQRSPPPVRSDRRIFDGPRDPRAERTRPAVGLDGGTAGSWSVHAGWVTGTSRRPGVNGADTFAVWTAGPRLYTAVGATARGTTVPADPGETRAGIGMLEQAAARHPQATARELLLSQQGMLRQGQASRGPSPSFAIGVFDLRVATYGSGRASLAAVGPSVGAWCLGVGGRPGTVLSPGTPRPRHEPPGFHVMDGDLVCLATPGLGGRGDGAQFRWLWEHAPDEPEFLGFLRWSAHGDDSALVAMWAGQYPSP